MLESTCLVLQVGCNSRSAACEHDDYGTGPRTPADPTAPVTESDGRVMLRMHTARASLAVHASGNVRVPLGSGHYYEAPEKKKRVLVIYIIAFYLP
jgi:hypothetical protein